MANGYFYEARIKRFRACLGVDNKDLHLGCFLTASEARAAYVRAFEKEYGFHPEHAWAQWAKSQLPKTTTTPRVLWCRWAKLKCDNIKKRMSFFCSKALRDKVSRSWESWVVSAHRNAFCATYYTGGPWYRWAKQKIVGNKRRSAWQGRKTPVVDLAKSFQSWKSSNTSARSRANH